MCAILISKAPRLARGNEGSRSFICHPHVYPYIWNEPFCLYFPAAELSITVLWYSYFPPRRWLEAELACLAGTCPPEDGHPSCISRGGWESNSQPSSRKSNAITSKLPSHVPPIGRCPAPSPALFIRREDEEENRSRN